jgi:hypothetical protein
MLLWSKQLPPLTALLMSADVRIINRISPASFLLFFPVSFAFCFLSHLSNTLVGANPKDIAFNRFRSDAY